MVRVDGLGSAHAPKISVVCDRSDTAPVWGYILRHKGLSVLLEQTIPGAFERWNRETPDLVVFDVDIQAHDPVELCRRFRALSVAPILVFLPGHHETQVLDCYGAGADEVIVKPVSPPIFLAKVMAWMRRSWVMPLTGLDMVRSGAYSLDPQERCLREPGGVQVKLTNLEFRLLHQLMSRDGQLFRAEELIQSIWGAYGSGDQVSLKNVVYRLRRKIEVDPGHPVLIRTWQDGYYFQG